MKNPNKGKILMKEKAPWLLEEWDYEKNEGIDINSVSYSSPKKVWWKCKNGHEWQAVVYTRVNGCGCAICSNKKLLKGYNDLAAANPEIAKEWHPTKNGDKTPADYLAGSRERVWWMCEKGHEWQIPINNRTRSHHANCPVCANKKVLAGYNDLATTCPGIAAQWHPTRNELTPQDVTEHSGKKVWWICEKGHEWATTVATRTDVNKMRGCPYCAGVKAIVGENDIKTLYPEIAAQWHPTRNGNKKPEDYKKYSEKRVWWMCENGHEWQAQIDKRCVRNFGCPYCSGRKVWKED